MHKLQITYEQLLETIQEGIWVYDADSNITFINPKMAEISGYEIGEMIGKTIYDIFYEEGIKNVGKRVEGRKSGISETYEEKLKHKDGHAVYVEIKVTHIIDDEGNYNGGIAGFTDISKRKEAEEALRVSEERNRAILNTLPDIMFTFDYKGIFLDYHANDNSLRAVEPSQFLGKSILEVLPVEVATQYMKGFEQAYATNQLQIFDYLLDVPEGLRHFEARITPMDEQRVLAVAQDITERKQAEKELLKFKTAVEQSADGVAMADMSGNILFINDAWAEMHGYTSDEVRGLHLSVFHNKEQVENHVTPFNENLIAKGSNQGEVGHTRKDGTTFLTYMATTILKGAGGEPFGMLAIARDITEHKKIEEALRRQASERAAVDAFTNSVSHDMQAPLRRIEGFSEALLEECPDELSELARDYLERITRQIDSMKVRTDALLELSRVVSHGIKNEEVNLSRLARSHLKKLRYAEPDRLVETVVTPELEAKGDFNLLSVALENLLHNAWKSTASVEKARIEFGSIVKDGHTVYYVRDNGVGFDQQRADEIFDPFKKLHSETDYPGIGIGLNLVYRIITRHGGEVWAEGEEGRGACFCFTLP